MQRLWPLKTINLAFNHVHVMAVPLELVLLDRCVRLLSVLDSPPPPHKGASSPRTTSGFGLGGSAVSLTSYGQYSGSFDAFSQRR